MDLLILSIASIATGFTYILDKKLSLSNHKAETFAFLTSIANAFIAIPLLFINFYISTDINIWVLIFISCAVFGLSRYFIYKAYQTTDVSIVSIIHKLNIVVGALLGIIIFKEQYSLLAYLGLTLIVLSSILILYKGRKIILDIGIIYAVIMAVLTAIAAIIDKAIINDFSSYTYVFVNSVVTAFFFSFNKRIYKNSYVMFKNNWKIIILRSILNTASWAAFIIILQNSSVSKTFPIYKSLSLIIPVVLGMVLLNERSRLWQKIMGLILGILGILLVAYS